MGPEPSLVIRSAAPSGHGYRRAREARNDAIHDAVEGSSIESHDIPEDFRFREAEPEAARGLRVVFDRRDASVVGEGDFDCEVEPSDSGAK
jgi:hypothetical protein